MAPWFGFQRKLSSGAIARIQDQTKRKRAVETPNDIRQGHERKKHQEEEEAGRYARSKLSECKIHTDMATGTADWTICVNSSAAAG